MEFKRRRMIKSEIDRLLSDEGTRNLLQGINVIHKSKKLTRIVTRNNRVPSNKSASTKGLITSVNSANRIKVNNSKVKTNKIIKKSLSLLGHGKNKSTNNDESDGGMMSGIAKKSGQTGVKVVKPKISNGAGFKITSNGPAVGKIGKAKMSNGTAEVKFSNGGVVKFSRAKISNGPGGGGGGARKVTNKISNGAKLSNAKMTNGPGVKVKVVNNNARAKMGTGGGVRGGKSTTTNNNGVVISGTTGNSGASSVQPLLATLVRGHVGFITLSYSRNSCVLRTQDLKDLARKLEDFESRKGINVIVVSSCSDRIFCDGCDYKELVHSDLNKRKKIIARRIACIKGVLNTLANSKKLLIASVNGGRVSGFGLMLIGQFDLVYANDKATFTLQKYSQLQQPPEGISVFNPTQLQSPTMKSFIYMGRVSTASEMHQNGFLVTEVLWDGSKYHEQFATKLQNANSLQYTKSIYKTYSSKNTKQLGNDLAHEFSILDSIWMSESWQKNAVQVMQHERDSLNFS